jgi:Heavy metal associated domain 2
VESEGVRVVHAIPGRIRLKVAQLKDNPGLAEAIHDRLMAVRGIDWVEISPRTGSVLVLYERARLDASDSLHALSEALQPLVPGLDLVQLQSMIGRESNGSHGVPVLDRRRITGLFGTINSGVGNVTGVDLRVLVPVALFFLGIRSLVATDQVRFPSWYDFLWFSFGTFLALNPLEASGTPPAAA